MEPCMNIIMYYQADAPPSASLLTYRGDIIISIKFTPADKVQKDGGSASKKKTKKLSGAQGGRLMVLIKEARNLTAVRSNGFSDPFCKG